MDHILRQPEPLRGNHQLTRIPRGTSSANRKTGGQIETRTWAAHSGWPSGVSHKTTHRCGWSRAALDPLASQELTASGKLVFGIFAALAEVERELISEHTIAGLASAAAVALPLPGSRPPGLHRIRNNRALGAWGSDRACG